MDAMRLATLDDKYVLERGHVYLSGIQALVRLPLDVVRRDRAGGLETAGYISGYRGSPLAGYDQQLEKAGRFLDRCGIVFQPGVNEELAATAVWGSQKLGLRGAARHDGVFGIWFGKAPGVDRTLDVFRHANASGTAAAGGVLAVAGDDHLAKSSSLPAQSEFAFIHAEIPVLCPSDIQDVLDFGLHGIALSRFAGVWVGLIALADTMDSSGVVCVDPERLDIRRPLDMADPRSRSELNRTMRLATRLSTEGGMRAVRLPAVKGYVYANRLDRRAFGAARPRIGIVASGKAFRDLMQSLELMGIDEALAREIGLAVFKVAMAWPLEPEAIGAFARGLDRLLVIEHKRGLVEPQLKELLYHWPAGERPQIWGKRRPDGRPFLPETGECGVDAIAPALLDFLPRPAQNDRIREGAARIAARRTWAEAHASAAVRAPYFCSGCPHNISTLAPEGSRTLPGIGCHAMTEIAGRATDGLVAMGGEGVPWLGQFPFSTDTHAFANLGDGTYYHSGILAIRAAVAANAPITYKLLYNDAVAMTGGQKPDGPLDVPRLVAQLDAEGVGRIVVLSERPHLYRGVNLAGRAKVMHRDAIMTVQRELRGYRGVSAIVFDQTCAAEKRRRRKHGAYEDPDRRLFINTRVCEDCGDCSVQSNCISVEPVETAFGRKRRISQSTCNKDYSCAKGFCPSFVVVEGGRPAGPAGHGLDVMGLAGELPVPGYAPTSRPVNLLITGVGGTGVTTTAAILAMAAHLDGLDATTLDMTGLAQKNGPVSSHVRIARRGMAIEGPRVPAGALDGLIAGDLLVAAGAEPLALCAPDRTRGVYNKQVAPTAEFVMRQRLDYDPEQLAAILEEATARAEGMAATRLAERLLGESIFANMILLGAAWQTGLAPVSLDAIEQAIRLNGAAADANRQAFHAGRLLAARPEAFATLLRDEDRVAETTLEERIDFLAEELELYQDRAYADRLRRAIARLRDAEERLGHPAGELTRAAAESLYRLMAYKDEYEVARLYAAPQFRQALERQFDGIRKVSVQLAPPLLARTDPHTGRPRKITFGPWVFQLFALLARLKGLRGTVFDPFGYTQERRTERRLISDFETRLEMLTQGLTAERYELAQELARLPQSIRGYGPVKLAAVEAARRREDELVRRWTEPGERSGPTSRLDAAE
jgi:indolepyruvate ferredoxin oxidoreductase